ncbi:MAG: hypothetical protein HY562_00635 [Ignavibacteriales bacterium]|nr:hypothetical protein [Ignavibacteriales bacterium]
MGQTMLILGAFALLSVLTLSVNQTLLMTQTIGLEMEANLTALSVAQSLMDEITTKEFDERTTTGLKIYSPDEMTAIGSLGPEVGETEITWVDSAYYNNGGATAPYDNGGVLFDFRSKTYYDDVDDYHGYRRKMYDNRMGYFDVAVRVYYVNEDTPDSASSSRTNQKAIWIGVRQFNLSKNLEGEVLPVILTDLAVYRRFFQ